MTEYNIKLQQLQKEFKSIDDKRANKWEFKPYQKAIFDFVMQSKKSVVFKVLDYEIILRVGTEHFGFKHFLIKHYGVDSVGEIKAIDILNIGNVIKNNICVPANDDKIKFIQTKGELKYSLILKKESNGKLIVSFFSSK